MSLKDLKLNMFPECKRVTFKRGKREGKVTEVNDRPIITLSKGNKLSFEEISAIQEYWEKMNQARIQAMCNAWLPIGSIVRVKEYFPDHIREYSGVIKGYDIFYSKYRIAKHWGNGYVETEANTWVFPNETVLMPKGSWIREKRKVRKVSDGK